MKYKFVGNIAYCQDRYCIKANNGCAAPVVDVILHQNWHWSGPLVLFMARKKQTQRKHGVIGFYERMRLAGSTCGG